MSSVVGKAVLPSTRDIDVVETGSSTILIGSVFDRPTKEIVRQNLLLIREGQIESVNLLTNRGGTVAGPRIVKRVEQKEELDENASEGRRLDFRLLLSSP